MSDPLPIPHEGPGCCGGVSLPDVTGRDSGFYLTENIVWSTNVTLGTSGSLPEYSGFDFSEETKKRFDDQFADVYLDEVDGTQVMRVRDDSEILECGFARSAYNAIYVPRKEWSESGTVTLTPGYEYLVRTWDMHYAKFAVTSVSANRISFDWAYQTSPMVTADVTPETSASRLK